MRSPVHKGCASEKPEEEAPRATVLLDLNEPIALASAPLLSATNPEEPILHVDRGTVSRLESIEVPWTEKPVNAFVIRKCQGPIFVITSPMGVPEANAVYPDLVVRDIDASLYPGRQIPLQVPSECSLFLIDVRTTMPHRQYRRGAWLQDGHIRITRAVPEG